MNNKRKDILKKGIDVTLYPLPFRKGGKIMNAGMGDKTVKPGIEYGGGGGLPKINDLGKAKIASDATRTVNPRAEATKLGATDRLMRYQTLSDFYNGKGKPTNTITNPGKTPGTAIGQSIFDMGVYSNQESGTERNWKVRDLQNTFRPKSKFNLGGVMTGGGGGTPDPKKVNYVSRFGDTTYEAPKTEIDAQVVNRYGLPFYRLGRTEFQMIPGVEYPDLNTLTGASAGEGAKNVNAPLSEKKTIGSVLSAGLGQRKSKFGM